MSGKQNRKNRQIPVALGEVYETEILRLGNNGEGVGAIEGMTVFLPHALPGERVRLKIEEIKANYAKGRLTEIISPSPHRAIPKCPVYEECGGCQLQHLSYEAQCRLKGGQVADALAHVGGQRDITVLDTIGAAEPWNYRNKMQFPVGRIGGHIVTGCFAMGSHHIVDTPLCHIQKEGNNEVAAAFREVAESLSVPVYDEDSHRGVLRHIVSRVGAGGEIMAVIVTATHKLPREKDFVIRLRERLPRLKSLYQNIQTYRNNVIMGRESRLLWGRPSISDSIGGMRFNISPRSFFQVNTEQAEVLYKEALGYAALSGKETVLDAYCGTGTITSFLAKKARHAIGVEVVPSAITDAKRNARENHIKNVEFHAGDAAKLLPSLYGRGIRPDVIVADPPRAGCAPEVLHAFARMSPSRIVYVSCNPASLARDVSLLRELGYKTEEVRPVDMFPQTSHVECVALIQKN